MNRESTETDPPPSDCQVDIWYVHTDGIEDERLFDEYRARLPQEELERAGQFLLERSRLEYLVTRMLVRSVLSHYTGLDLAEWRFTRNTYGKPEVGSPADLPLSFNLSHAAGLVVCAVTGGRDVGIDAESRSRRMEHLTLARRFFASSEADAIERAPPERQADLFLRFWTLKEAFIKARGMGMSIPLADVAFTLGDERPPAVSFAKNLGEKAEDWQFVEMLAGTGHHVALAARIPLAERAEIRVRETVPLRWKGDIRQIPPDTALWSI